MFKKLLESLDAIANESKYPWLDHPDRPGNKKKSEFTDAELAKQEREEKIKLKPGEGNPKKYGKVNEVSDKTKNSYAEKASKEAEDKDLDDRKTQNRVTGILRSTPKKVDEDQTEMNLQGGKATHPGWKSYLSGKAGNSSPQAMAADLYKEHQGKKIAKSDVDALWKSYGHNLMTRITFKPDYQKIGEEYSRISKGLPPSNLVKEVAEAVTLSADGDEAMELINGMRKLAGMSPVAGALSPVPAQAPAPVAAAPAPEAPPAPVTPEPAPPVSNAEQTTAAFASLPADSWDDEDEGDEQGSEDDEQMVVGGDADSEDEGDDEEKVKEASASIYANTPDESTQDADAVTGSGDDMHKKKKGFPSAAGGDNPMNAFEGKFKAIMADLLKE